MLHLLKQLSLSKVFFTSVSISSSSFKIIYLFRHQLKFKFCCQASQVTTLASCLPAVKRCPFRAEPPRMDHHSEYPLGGRCSVNCEFREEKAMRNFASKSFIDAEFLHLSFVCFWSYSTGFLLQLPGLLIKIPLLKLLVQYILGNCWLCPLSLFFL